jgi:hypothetical protein
MASSTRLERASRSPTRFLDARLGLGDELCSATLGASSMWRPACAAAARSASASWLYWASRVSLRLGGQLLGNGGDGPLE